MLHFNSHHPSSTKKATALNELQRATESSSAPNQDDTLHKTRRKLTNNGYPRAWISELESQMTRKTVQCGRSKSSSQSKEEHQYALKIPFISDQFNYAMKQILRRHVPARLVNARSTTVQDLTKKNTLKPKVCRSRVCPAPGICQRTSVVYCATCQLCQAKYVGHDYMDSPQPC